MKNLRRLGINAVFAAFAFLACSWALESRAQTGGLDLSQLQLVASNAIPSFGNFYFAQNYGIIPRATGISAFGPPLPFDPRPDLPLYSLNDGNHDFIIDDYGVDYSAQAQSAVMARRSGGMMAMDSGEMLPAFSFPSNSLWLQITNVIDGLTYVDLNNATDVVYEILTTTNLLDTNWTIEEEVWSTNQTVMPFTIPENGRTNLFVWAMDWTGVTENGNTTPDWWFWQNFGTTALSDTNLDGQGNTLLYDYQNGVNPNLIAFTLGVTNQYVNTTVTPMTLNVTQGVPFYGAVLVDDTNLGDAVWTPYASSNLSVTLGGAGWHGVWVGLRGHATNSQQVWTYVGMDYVPFLPGLFITNPAVTTTVQPMIQLQGYSPVPLASLTYDLNNAAGLVTNQAGFVTDQYYDSNVFEFSTNYFQCYDLGLTAGTNLITLHGTDIAGNTTSTNFSLVVIPGTNAPVITLNFPQDSMTVCGGNFTVDGWLDNPTAGIMLTAVDTNGCTNSYSGEVERSGRFWVEDLPLAAGTNNLTLTATDVWGDSTVTNLAIFQSAVTLTLNTFDSNQLFQPTINLSGTISDAGATISVNGVAAVNNGDGTWSASNVPTTDNGGGTVSFSFALTNSQGSPVAMTADDDKPDRIYVDSYHQDLTNVVHARQDDLQTAYADLGWPYDYWWLETWSTNTLNETWQIGLPGQESVGSSFASDNYYFAASPPEVSWNTSCAGAASWPAATTPDASVVTSSGPESCGGQALPGMAPQFLPMATWEYCNVTTSSQTGQYTTYFYVDPTTGEWLKNVEADEFQYTRHANASIKYYSGGKAVSGRQNLIQFNASAWQMTNLLDQPPYAWHGNSPVDGVAIPPTEITLGGAGQLGDDGMLYKEMPDDATIDITPRAPQSYNFYTFNVGALKHKLRVTANDGIELSNDHVVTDANFCVGQSVILSPSWNYAPGDIQSKLAKWTVNGQYVNYEWQWFDGEGFYGSQNYTNLSSLLTNEIQTNWWYSGGFDAPQVIKATIGINMTFSNGQQVVVTSSGLLNMYRPKVVMVNPAIHGSPANVWITPWNSLEFGDIGLGQPGGPNNMSYDVQIISPRFAGYAKITQLCSLNATALVNIHTTNWLDNSDPYQDADALVLTNLINPFTGSTNNIVNLDDAPQDGWVNSFQMSNSFTDYIMFTPGSSGGIYVTLGKVSWGVSAGANYSSTNINPNTVTGPTGPDGSNDFPTWVYVYLNSN